MDIDDIHMMNLQQCETFIKTNYIQPLIAFLRKQQAKIATASVFQKCRTAINEQCDAHDRSQQIHNMYKRIVEDYFNEEIKPSLAGKFGENFLLELVLQWNNYTIFAMLLNRLFDYLDINYVKSNFLSPLGKHCQQEFKNRVIIGLEAELQGAIKD